MTPEVIGDYVSEILDEFEPSLPMLETRLFADFIADNPRYWNTIKSRMVSYWHVYYRWRWPRENYIGFRILQAMEKGQEG